MKKIIAIFWVNLSIVCAVLCVGCSKKTYQITGNAIKLVGIESEERFSNSIITTNDITFNCSLNYQMCIDKETGDFLLELKDKESSYKTVVLSCNREISETEYYSYEDVLLYKNRKTDNEFIKFDEEYCNTACSYVIIFIENDEEVLYAKFIRE